MSASSPIVDEWGQDALHACGAPYGRLHVTQAKEQFSLAYLHAIATAARCNLSDPRVDDERVDVTIRQRAGRNRYSGGVLDVQLKCTEQDVMKDDGLHWSLSGEHFNDLADPKRYVPVILVVMRVPESLSSWLRHDEGSMVIQRDAYWVSLREQSETQQATKTVVLPRENRFDVGSLLTILGRIASGGMP